ncbi:thioredoxin [Selenomonas caprae]|uniref:Thioredoxin n=1 Tax=Selenomonas caprae TaxID=2606905 RepID=A0A5D6WTR9_9FIRM|nr:CD1871A family CXXC motif-containing protein [Selenomonas caprae]TYZ29754.1 thioredoxin [Selenomonas caprae]
MTRLAQLRSLLLALAAGCILWGLWRGEARIIFHKAVRVCMECIGLG